MKDCVFGDFSKLEDFSRLKTLLSGRESQKVIYVDFQFQSTDFTQLKTLYSFGNRNFTQLEILLSLRLYLVGDFTQLETLLSWRLLRFYSVGNYSQLKTLLSWRLYSFGDVTQLET